MNKAISTPKTPIMWGKMKPDERFNTLVKVVSKASNNGIIGHKGNEWIMAALARYNLKDAVFSAAGVSSMRPLGSMSKEERFGYAVKYIRENAVNGVFNSTDHFAFYQHIHPYGIYKKAKEKALKIKSEQELQCELLSLSKLHGIKPLKKCETLADIIAAIQVDKIAKLNKGQGLISPYYEMLINLMHFGETRLDLLTLDKLVGLIEEIRGPSRTTTTLKKRFVAQYLVPALNEGVYVDAALEFGDGKHIKVYTDAARANIKKPKTVLEYCILDWNNGIPQKYATLSFLKKYTNILPEEFSWSTARDYLPKGWSKASAHTLHSSMKKSLFAPLQRKGIFPESFFSLGAFEAFYEELKKEKYPHDKEARTVGWYTLKVFDLNPSSSSSHKSKFFKKFGPFLNMKPQNLTAGDIQKMKEANGNFSTLDVVRTMIEDGVCSDKLLENNTKPDMYDSFDFSSNIWHFGKRSTIDFTEFDKNFRYSMKRYVEEYTDRFSNNRTIRPKILYDLIEELKKIGLDQLEHLTKDVEKKLYVSLGLMAKNKKEVNKAREILKSFRSVVKTLQKNKCNDIIPSGFKPSDSFSIASPLSKIETYSSKDMRKILDFIKSDASITGKYMSRLEVCAFGLTALLARRIGEIVKSTSPSSTGLEIDAICRWGHSSEYMLKYYCPKHKKHEQVLLSDLVGKRKDPFGQELIDVALKLFNEATEITSSYRQSLPKKLKECLFVVPGNSEAYVLLQAGKLRKRVLRLLEAIGIKREQKGLHAFRHTMAINLILSGGTIMDVADALQDKVQTVAKHYIKSANKIETLKFFAEKGRTSMVNTQKDSEYFAHLDKNEHQVLRPEEISPGGHKMAGGKCGADTEYMLNCPSYQMIRTAKGCHGCKNLTVNSVDNKDFWKADFNATLAAMETATPGSYGYRWEKANNDRGKSILDSIREKEIESEFS